MRHGNHNPRRAEIEPIAAAQTPGSIASPRVPCRKPSEDGYTLLAVIFLLAILTLWMSVAVPKMTRSIQRDHEIETMHRGKQYIRAVQLYYRKFHAYPPSMDALVKTNEIRFLRKKYIDPMTGKDDWKPIMFGQNKAPIVMGSSASRWRQAVRWPASARAAAMAFSGIGWNARIGVERGLAERGERNVWIDLQQPAGYELNLDAVYRYRLDRKHRQLGYFDGH